MTGFVGALKDVSALELGAIAARGAFDKTGIKPAWVDHVIIGNVLQTSADAVYGARHVALQAGVPVEVPALTVNRLCGSGIQAAISGAQLKPAGGNHRTVKTHADQHLCSSRSPPNEPLRLIDHALSRGCRNCSEDVPKSGERRSAEEANAQFS